MPTQAPPDVRRAQSLLPDAADAAREVHAALTAGGHDAALVLVFTSPTHDLDALGAALGGLFGDTPVVGCTTAGEIGPAGYLHGSLVGVALPASHVSAVTGHLDGLATMTPDAGSALGEDLVRRLEEVDPDAGPATAVALLLVDGLSHREETVLGSLRQSLGAFPVVGGSAGDELAFGSAQVYSAGAFRTDRAAVVLLTTRLPFAVFKTEHVTPTDRRLVVTDADAATRVVRELDGHPAADHYARVVGLDVADLDPARFSAHPLAVRVGEQHFVRSIATAEPDGSLRFLAAIEEGMVLRPCAGGDLIGDLAGALDKVRAELGGEPSVVLGFDCVLRRLEAEQLGLSASAAELFEQHRVVGFHGYGEQYGGLHVNQTFVGLALGGGRG